MDRSPSVRLATMPSIGSVMTPCPHCVDADDSLLLARAVMQRHDVRHLPVVSAGTLVGVLTDRDVKRALDPDLGLPPLDELFVRDLFVPDAYIVEAAEPLDDVLAHMSAHHIGSALVTTDGHLTGIFTVTDACRAFCRFLRASADSNAHV
jgi:acetoin utilization protein AcuB